MPEIVAQKLLVGLEIHVQLATRTKMFTRVGSPAHEEFEACEPNTLIDPVVLGLPGALPVMNREAVEMAIRVGLALGCSIAERTKWDRKSYYYPDLPKAYQISQYDLPLCFDGACEFTYEDTEKNERTKRVGIVRAHLEEDAGKLLHEAPGGEKIDFSIVDFNRAGTPLLEIVTHPDFDSADEVVAFAQHLRQICRHLGVSHGVMQKGHMRFEPNINLHLTMGDGSIVKTPIIEIKNLNSFRALKGAIEHEAAHQGARYLEDGKVMGPGAKTTRGWDDTREITFVQREKEDAHDYRYFPDPDLVPVTIEPGQLEGIREVMPELPGARFHRLRHDHALSSKEASAIVDEPSVARFFDGCVEAIVATGIEHGAAGKQASNMLLQAGAKRANENGVTIDALGITPAQVAGIVELRKNNEIGSSAGDDLFGLLCESDEDARATAERANLLQVSDEGALREWCQQVIDDPANAQAVADVRGGKGAAIGRLIGGVMKASGGKAEAKGVQQMLRELLS
ncbi:MAG: Asp-tRNA(Asn)/Glu-tRNA(Gln) amidotransferase subunit GatB [Planctomycetota bacterium]|jgi:aspartyl-tRNA(Asn)/glutamyl-tRNA(Gln) amidotransferase subunit B